MTAAAVQFASVAFTYSRAQDEFESSILALVADAFDWNKLTFDSYDTSIEFHGVPYGCELPETVRAFLAEQGFSQCWINFMPGGDKHYYLRTK